MSYPYLPRSPLLQLNEMYFLTGVYMPIGQRSRQITDEPDTVACEACEFEVFPNTSFHGINVLFRHDASH